MISVTVWCLLLIHVYETKIKLLRIGKFYMTGMMSVAAHLCFRALVCLHVMGALDSWLWSSQS